MLVADPTQIVQGHMDMYGSGLTSQEPCPIQDIAGCWRQ